MSHLLRLIAALLALVAAAPALATDYVIALPQTLAPEDAQRLTDTVNDLVLQAQPGDTLRLIDASRPETVAVFTIPTDGRAKLANLRLRAMAQPMAEWAGFLAAHFVNADAPAPDHLGTIRLPQTLDVLAQAYVQTPPANRHICTLIVGSPLYLDAEEPGFSMLDGRFPADGLVIGAAETESPYGVLDRQGQLTGMAVHMWILPPPGTDELFDLRVQRTWFLHLTGRGASLATYTPDAAVAIQRFKACDQTPARSFTPDSTRDIRAMIDIQRVAQMAHDVTAVPIEPVAPPVIDAEPDMAPTADGSFGQVVRLDSVDFGPGAGLIGFDEVPVGTANPVYTGAMYKAPQSDIKVAFGGYFVGQRLGSVTDCPAGANVNGCVLGQPSDQLSLDPAAGATMVVVDGSNPESPALSGSPRLNGPVAILFDHDVAAVGLAGGYFDTTGSTAIQAYDRQGHLIGGVVNRQTGMEYLALATRDGVARIAGIGFSLVGDEPNGYAVDTIRFALPGQYDAAASK